MVDIQSTAEVGERPETRASTMANDSAFKQYL